MTVPNALDQDGTYPRPQLVRNAWADLSGTWDFAVDARPRATPATIAFDRTIQVPYPPESLASGIGEPGFAPVVWYRRTIGPDDLARAGHAPDRPRVLLHLGAVDWAATVWVGGHLVARHVGGHTPFSVDITEALGELDQPTTVVVRAFDDPQDTAQARGKQDWHPHQHSIWYDRTTGIWQPVWLEAVPEQHVVELQWTPRVRDCAVDLALRLAEDPLEGSEVHVRLLQDGRQIAAGRWPVMTRDWQASLPVAVLRNGQALEEYLWSPESPRLVQAEVTLATPRGADEMGSYLGLRSVGTTESDLLLNDRPYFLRAVLEQGYWPQSHLAAPSPGALREEVGLIKSLGFNCVRVHQKAEDPRFLYWADREGLLVWGEMASAYTFSARAVTDYAAEWTAVVRRDRSHPCIITWVPLNESWGVHHIAHDPAQQAYARAIADLTRALDPGRPVVSNDGWEHVDSDLWTVHDYTDDPQTLLARFGTPASALDVVRTGRPGGRAVLLDRDLDPNRPRRPILLSEFGGVSFDPTASANSWGYSVAANATDFADRVTGLVSAAIAAQGIAGFCYTQLTDTGLETNGLLHADRTPKLPVDRLRRMITAPRPKVVQP